MSAPQSAGGPVLDVLACLEDLDRKLGQLHVLLLSPSLGDCLENLNSEERVSYLALGADVAKECRGMVATLSDVRMAALTQRTQAQPD